MNLSLRRIIAVCTWILVCCRLTAQISGSVSYRHYDTRDGLPSTQIQGVFEDSKGFIWAITDRGVARFDGYEFLVYTTANGLPSNNVLLINEDHHGRMWFMCNTGEYAFLEGDSIRSYNGNKRIGELLKDKLPGPFFFDDKDTLWITTFSGIQLFKCYGDSVSEYKPAELVAGQPPTYYMRKVGEKLVTLQVGDVTANTRVSTTDNINYLLDVAGECKLACSVEVEKGTWAVAGPGGFVIFDESANVQAYFDYSPFLFSTLEHDRNGQLWLTNSNGAYRIRDFRNGPNDADVFFEGHFITAVLQDRSGNYWFGDRDNGLFFVPSLDIKVFNDGEASKQNKCVAIKRFKDEIFYCDAEGKLYHLKEGIAERTDIKIPSGVTLDFVLTQKGNVVLGNKPMLYDMNSGRLKALDEARTVRKALMLKDGTCAFALSDGLAFLDQQEQWSVVSKDVFKERSNALFEDVNGDLIIGSNSGLFLWRQGKAEAFETFNKTYKPRVSDVDRWGDYLVIATRTSGIYFLKGETVFELNESNGLASNTVDCLLTDDKNQIWIGTASGIQKLVVNNIQQKEWNLFRINYQKGLPSNEVNDLMFFNEQLYVATNDGFCVINPQSVSLSGVPAKVILNDFACGEIHFDISKNQSLKYDQNNIQFSFLSLNYRTGTNTTYRYRLKELQTDWHVTQNKEVAYWSIPAGSYRFEVCAMNEDGDWGEAVSVDFVIEQHFTKTWWFLVGVVLLFFSAIAGTLFLIYRNKKRKLEIKAKMISLRQQALNANMNPHFIFNALGSIQHFINSGKSEDANEYLSDFSRLIRMNLENNQHSLVSLEDELDRLQLYLKLEKLRFAEKLEYSINIDSDVPYLDCLIPPMLLQPYVENALIHGILAMDNGGKIDVRVSTNEKQYFVEILDNGIGINTAMQKRHGKKQSLALQMNKERMATLKALTGLDFEITIDDRSDLQSDQCGTRVLVSIPLEISENALFY